MAPINVIIPFYQRKRGILPAAVNSALAQGIDDLLITVVDDGSPVPARDELASIIALDQRVVIIEQENGGAGAARNRGLDATPGATEYIAFLDSDDRWLQGHLARAMASMRLGADFYFADYRPLDTGSRFAQVGFSASLGEPVEGVPDLFFHRGNLLERMVPRSPVGTQTVVFRRAIAPDLRFRTDLFNGQDIIFWMELARAARKVAFSTICAAVCGRGINIAAAANWGTPEGLRRSYHWAKMHRLMIETFRLSREQQRDVHAQIASIRRGFAANLWHLLRRRESIDWPMVAAYLRSDPRLAGDLIAALGKGALQQVGVLSKQKR